MEHITPTSVIIMCRELVIVLNEVRFRTREEIEKFDILRDRWGTILEEVEYDNLHKLITKIDEMIKLLVVLHNDREIMDGTYNFWNTKY